MILSSLREINSTLKGLSEEVIKFYGKSPEELKNLKGETLLKSLSLESKDGTKVYKLSLYLLGNQFKVVSEQGKKGSGLRGWQNITKDPKEAMDIFNKRVAEANVSMGLA